MKAFLRFGGIRSSSALGLGGSHSITIGDGGGEGICFLCSTLRLRIWNFAERLVIFFILFSFSPPLPPPLSSYGFIGFFLLLLFLYG